MGKNIRYFSTEDPDNEQDQGNQGKNKKTALIKGGKIVGRKQFSKDTEQSQPQGSNHHLNVIKPSLKTIEAKTSYARPFGKSSNKKWSKSKRKKKNLGPDPYPEKPTVPKEKLDKYSRGA